MDRTAGSAAQRTAPGRPASRRLAAAAPAIVGVVAGACYSSFLAAGAVGSRLSITDSYVSELGVPGQPASAFFRATDLAAGVFIAVLAVALGVHLRPERRGTLGFLCLAGVGLASIVDGLRPMPCTPSTSEPCRRHIDEVTIFAQLHQGHTVSSVLGVLAAQAAMLLLGASPRVRRSWPRFARASLVSGVVLVVLGLSEVPLALYQDVGVLERIHVLLISAWIAALGWYPSRARSVETPPVRLHRGAARVGHLDGGNPRRRRHLLPLPTAGGRRAGRVRG
ncbi:DUF998 domain-containing protein [Planosporangium flavigriseum]|uniref:DUF998 domain-containing protein n=1 Tax=Planosporangium flavigriseum TaxID=373681 RepID=A0A8J3LX58_9ACTN|nr:DUF998 domain-containing protein [Planosporangium flavigriseum]NJC67330.1 DUF998 domain-containing protein [Planosporangium flavigriseum]GIG75414.1 hypothetical protein Pfl04_38180 [Planosporangium flavigriseum]